MSRPRPRLWWGLAAMTVIIALFGIGDIWIGIEADVGIPVGVVGLTPGELREQSEAGYRLADFLARSAGLVLLTLGVAMTAIVAGPYRRRDAWAWKALWLLPAWAITVPVAYLLVGIQPNAPPPPPMVSGPIFAAAAAAILVIDRRAFRGRPVPAAQRIPIAATPTVT